MKSRVEETPRPSCCPAAFFDPESFRGSLGCSTGKLPTSSIRSIRVIRGLILPLFALVCFVLFSSPANANPALIAPGKSSSSAFGCAAVKKGRRLARQNRNVLPDSAPNDLDDANGGLDEVSAATATRHDQDTPWLSTATLNPIALHEPGSVPAFLLPVQCFYNLRKHIRERAPPDLA